MDTMLVTFVLLNFCLSILGGIAGGYLYVAIARREYRRARGRSDLRQ